LHIIAHHCTLLHIIAHHCTSLHIIAHHCKLLHIIAKEVYQWIGYNLLITFSQLSFTF